MQKTVKVLLTFFLINQFAWGSCALTDSLEVLYDARRVADASTHPNAPFLRRLLESQERRIDNYIDGVEGFTPTQRRAMESDLLNTRQIISQASGVVDDAVEEIRYINPGHHDRSSGVFRGGGSMTTDLPSNHQQLFENAVPFRNNRGRWDFWVCTSAGVFHRFQGQIEGGVMMVHWNGTSEGARGIRGRDIPNEIRRFYGNSNSNCNIR